MDEASFEDEMGTMEEKEIGSAMCAGILKLRRGKCYVYRDHSKTDDSSDSEDSSCEDEKGKELTECRPGLNRSCSADIALIRAADSPFDNRFLYFHDQSPDTGERRLQAQMGFVNPRQGGKGVFKRVQEYYEQDGEIVVAHKFTNIHYDKTLGVNLVGQQPSISIMPPQSDTRTQLFKKIPQPRQSYLLESVYWKGYRVSYTDSGHITLTQKGSLFTEREGSSANETVELKQSSALSTRNLSDGFRSLNVT